MRRAARLRLHLRYPAREAGVWMQEAAALEAGEVDEVDLDVGARNLGPRAHEGRGVAGGDRERPFLEKQVIQADARLAPRAHHVVVKRDGAGAAPERAHVKMILQALADLRRVMHHRYAMALEQRAGSDARQLEQLGRIERTATQNNLISLGSNGLPALLVLDAYGSFVPENHFGGKRSGRDSKIRSLFCFSQISTRGATAPAAIRRGPVVTGALLGRGVEVAV